MLYEIARELHIAGGQGEQREQEVEDVDSVEQVQLGRPSYQALLLGGLRTVFNPEGEVGDHQLKVDVDEEEWRVFKFLTVLKAYHQDH